MFVLTSFTVTVEDTKLNPMTIKIFSSHDAKARKLVTNLVAGTLTCTKVNSNTLRWFKANLLIPLPKKKI